MYSPSETVGREMRTQLLIRKLTDGDATEEIPTVTDLLDCQQITEDGNIYIRRHT